MKCTPEKANANRLNALKSTGPKTEAGKAISRRNGLKHGLTGEGVVLPFEDVERVAGRFDRIVAEMKPKTEMGFVLAERMSIMSVRLGRCVDHETASLTERVKQAEMIRIEERLAFIDELFDGLSTHPYTNARQLQDYPEGVDRMLDLYASVRAELTHPTVPMYDAYRFQRLDSLMGRLPADFPASRIKALSQAMFGNLGYLEPHDTEGFTPDEILANAKAGLLEIIDTQMARLSARRAFLEPRAVIHCVADAVKMARVDVTPEALLVKKYEAATERSLFRSLREFREVEDQARVEAEVEVEPEAVDVTPEQDEASDAVASVFPIEKSACELVEEVGVEMRLRESDRAKIEVAEGSGRSETRVR